MITNKQLKALTDDQLRTIYGRIIDDAAASQGMTVNEYNQALKEDFAALPCAWTNRVSARYVSEALADISNTYTKLNIHVTEETKQWSDMEDTRFNTTDHDSLNRYLAKVFKGICF